MTDWKTVLGSQEEKPAEFDTTSSEVVGYQRRNIHRATVKSGTDVTTTEYWEYEEREGTKEEVLAAQGNEQQLSIDDIYEALCDLDMG